MERRKLILVEFNELCPELLQRWMAEGKLPNFKRFYESSQVFTGRADVDDPTYLEPWIQWYSLHTGLSFDQHKIFHLTDGPKAGHLDIWHALQRSGNTVGNFAGMNSGRLAGNGSFYLPDPWCNSEPPFPPGLSAYQKVVLNKVQENSNSSARLTRKDYVDFLRFVATHGLRPGSILAVLQQLAGDLISSKNSWKRAALLDKFQLDLFLHYWNRSKPDFASFFVNSTAHFQHAYFHLLEPTAFDLPAEDLEDPVHQGAIFFGYAEMDKLLGDLFVLERDGAMLVLATALSQQPNPEAGSKYYRPRDAAAFLQQLDVRPKQLLPVMAQQFSAEFSSQEEANEARRLMERVTYSGVEVFQFSDAPPKTLFFGNQLHMNIPQGAAVELPTGNANYYDLFYQIPHTKSGAHHPDSVLWFKTGKHRVHHGKVSILDIFPTILEYYNANITAEDGHSRTGRSFLDLLGIEGASERPLMSHAAD